MTLTAPASQTSFATAAAEGGPHIPGPNDFWLPLFGPEGWQVTEQMVWSTVAVALLCTTMIALSRRAAVVRVLLALAAAAATETALIAQFHAHHGRRPFANMRN